MKKKIQHYKNELKSYTYYVNRINYLKRELDAVVHKMTGVTGIDTTQPRITSVSTSKENFFELMHQEEELNKRIAHYQERLDLIDGLLKWVDEPYDKVLRGIYIDKKTSYYKAIREYNIPYSESQLKRIINSQIRSYIQAFKLWCSFF